MSNENLIPVVLLILLSVALTSGTGIILLVLHWRRRHSALFEPPIHSDLNPFPGLFFAHAFVQRPQTWLAIRSRNVHTVQNALGLHNPQPCTWFEGLAGEQRLFIAPPVNGWILIVGSDLPDPADDVDDCFRFLLDLSRKLGHVQFFNSNRVLNHHAWIQASNGRVIRAYVWAGKTLWNQGVKTRAELELGFKCFHYLESPERTAFGPSDALAANTEKVPLLAARWSIDPADIDERAFEHAFGIAGETPRP